MAQESNARRKRAERKGGSAPQPAKRTARRRSPKRAAAGKATAPKDSTPRPLARLRKLCLALPESHEVEAWGSPTFRVRNKLFAMYADASDHHGGGRYGVWVKATRVSQDLMVRTAPGRFFVPPYVGPSGWVGVWLDGDVDWDELSDLLRDAYRMTAPKRMAVALEQR